MLDKEDMKWRQRTKRNWYQHPPDHTCANQRRKKNTSKRIVDDQNRSLSSSEKIKGAFKSYFEKLFTTTLPSTTYIEKCLKHLKPHVSREMNESISNIYTRREVEKAINHMDPIKSLGPDGFRACFYENH